ncbi:hypothetical protein [Mucilaginibacter gossypii]|uniref:hypothetical protein n=1 Tax=Mucilaginibacter gossypii TaxID=551996 RepID=UPI000A78530A|nr:hypothetical protein [Mucilaginibacter gossypii]
MQYQQLDEVVDGVAERMRKIGHYAPATLTQFLQLSHLTEKLENSNNSQGYTKELLADHESIVMFYVATSPSLPKNTRTWARAIT